MSKPSNIEETKEAPPSPTKTIKATESSRGSAHGGDWTTENIQIEIL